MRWLVLVPFLTACYLNEESEIWGPLPDAAPATSAQRDHGTVTYVTQAGAITESLDVRLLLTYRDELEGDGPVFAGYHLEGTRPFRCEGGGDCIEIDVFVPKQSGLGPRKCELGTSAEIHVDGMNLDTDGRLLPACSFDVVDDDTTPYISIRDLTLTWQGQTIRAAMTAAR